MTEQKKGEDLTICGGDDFLADQGIADPTSSGSKATCPTRSRPSPSSAA